MGATMPAAAHNVRQLVAYSPEGHGAEFRVGVHAHPYLADHGFQEMVVLPGSFYVELALRMERELFGRVPSLLRDVTFDSPITLSTDDVVISAEVRSLGEDCVEYTFHEAGVDRGNGRSVSSQRAA